MKIAITAKRVVILIMAMALAVALVACEGAAGKPGEPGQPGAPGEPGQPGAPGEPGGVPPRIDEPIPDLQLAASGAAATRTIDLNDHFFDPDGEEGEALTFAASSADIEVVTAAVSDGTLTLNAVAMGTARITVRATDVDGLTSGADRFNVTVSVTVAPMVTPILDQTLYQDDGPQTITLSDHFSHENTITYRVVSALPVGHVRAEIAEGTLTLTPLARGQAIVVVEATADDKSVTDDFMVDVESGNKPTPPPPPPPPPPVPPTLTAMIDDMMLYLVGDSKSIDLSGHFSHDSEITYETDVRGAAVDAVVSGSTLTVTPVLTGDSRVTVTATVGGQSTSDSFMVNVKPGSRPVVPKVAPTKVMPIPAQMIYQGDGAKTIDLTGHFSHDNEITYTAAVRGAAVDATISGSMLTLNPVLLGEAQVTVTAMADGMSSSYDFVVTVKAGTTPPAPPPPPPPEPDPDPMNPTIAEIDSQMLYWPHEETVEISVDDPDGDNDELEIRVMSDGTDTADVDLNDDNDLVIKSIFPGSAVITVTVIDEDDLETTRTFSVTISEPEDLTLDVNEWEDFPVLEGYTVESGDVQVVEVRGTSPDYEVRAKKKGSTTLDIIRDRRTVMRVGVTANNRAPELGKTTPLATSYALDAVATVHTDVDDDDIKVTEYKTTEVYAVAGITGGLAAFFEDPDEGDKLRFNARSNRPNHAIVAGIKEDGSEIYIDLLSTLGGDDGTIPSFEIIVSAEDDDSDMPLAAEDELVLKVNSVVNAATRTFTYEVDQNISGIRGLKKTVGLRKDAKVTNIAKFDNGILVLGDPGSTVEAEDSTASASYVVVTSSPNIMVVEDATEGKLDYDDTTGEEHTDISFKTLRTGAAWIEITLYTWDGTSAHVKETPRRLNFTVEEVERKSDDKVIIK